jgi:hypothetical protein
VALGGELGQRKTTAWRTPFLGLGSWCPWQELSAEGAQSHGAPYGLSVGSE